MNVGSACERVSAQLDDYLERFGMEARTGPLRAAGELTRGIVLAGSVQLTNAARLTAGTPEELAVAVNRLSGHLADPRWDHRDWAARILHEQTRQIEDDDLIPIDGTELAKPYARKMQYQDTIRDASRPGDPLVPGYWCWGAYHWQPERNVLRPLMLRPYSTHQPRYRSENDVWTQFFWTLRQATGGRGIWLSDRGGDRPEVLSAWLRMQPRWIIRLRRDRPLIGPDGSLRSAGFWAEQALATRPERGRAVTWPVRLPPEQVGQNGAPERLWLVVPTYTFGYDEDRWLLLTRGLVDQHVGPRQVRHDYALRWRAEDGKRLLGQLWHIERFMVRSFLALERLLWCVVAAAGFLTLLQAQETALAARLQKEVIYLKKKEPLCIPGYRIARGLTTLAAQQGYATIANNA